MFAQFTRQAFTIKDRSNIDSHVDSVEDAGVKIDPDELTRKKTERLVDWAREASDIDPDVDQLMAAAWRAALDEILNEDDKRILGIVRNLNPEEVHAMMDMLSDFLYDADIGSRLRSLGLATREFLKAHRSRVRAYVVLALISNTAALFVLSEILPFFQNSATVYYDDVARFVQIFKWAALFGSIIFTGIVILRDSQSFFSYSLTEFGFRIATKIKKYYDGMEVEKR